MSENRRRPGRLLPLAASLGTTLSLLLHAALLAALWFWSAAGGEESAPRLAGVREETPIRIRWVPPERVPPPAAAIPSPARDDALPPLAPFGAGPAIAPPPPVDRSPLSPSPPPELPPLLVHPETAPAERSAESARPKPLLPPTAAAASVLAKSAPVLLDRIEPVYPRSCLLARHEGVVELLLAIDSEGRVTGARVVGRSRCRELDESARKAALELRYEPAREGDRATAGEARLRVRFVIEPE